MKIINHTPGPWTANGIYINAPSGDRIAYMASRDEQAHKDARLIAAAPEMQGLLHSALNALELAIESQKTGWLQDVAVKNIRNLLDRYETI